MPHSLVQLATDWRGIIPAGGTMAEPKIDGWRMAYFRGRDGKARLWSRNGHPIEGAEHILYRLGLMESAAGTPMVFDGEYQVDGSLAATKAWCERGWRYGGEAGLFQAFDCLTYEEWISGGTERPLYERKAMLGTLSAQVAADPSYSWEWRPGSRGRDGEESPVRIVPDVWLSDARDVIAEANRVWAAGGEGIVLKDAEAPYQRKRSDAWQKVKAENQAKWLAAA